jgi:glucose/mannose-6-phosphate isomerase
MNLDDLDRIKQLDRMDMLVHIQGLPGQLEEAFHIGLQLPLPQMGHIEHVLIAGMGGSAIGADLLARYAAPLSPAPVTVHRDYELPAWAHGPHILVIASSHSGNTEETLSAYEIAQNRGCRTLAITTNGKLALLAESEGLPLWVFEHHGQPTAAVGYSFGFLLAAMVRLSLLPDPAADLKEALDVMRQQQKDLEPDVPVSKNPAKRLAGQLFGRWVTVLASGYLSPVARRWKMQISELAKAWAQFEFIPEADHNTLAGVVNPIDVLTRTMTIFLRSPSDHPRNFLRSNLTRQGFMIAGLNTDVFDAKGKSPLAHIWSALHFGDYMAFYMAMAYGVDPTPVEALESFKAAMRA